MSASLAAQARAHTALTEGCSCGWRFDAYDWPAWNRETPAQRWAEHVRKSINLRDHPPAFIVDQEGREHLLFENLRTVHHYGPTRESSAREAFAGMHGEYRLKRTRGSKRNRITCAEARCRNPYCHGAHWKVSLSIPTRRCYSCRKQFKAADKVVGIVIQRPAPYIVREGVTADVSLSLCERCEGKGRAEAAARRCAREWRKEDRVLEALMTS